MKNAYAFTLIELLIVVAIIGILAAIAVPNFMNAQIRAKISRAVSDMRTISQANEAYKVDWNVGAPVSNGRARHGLTRPLEVRFYRLTTPVVYLGSIPSDPFVTFANAEDYQNYGHSYDYIEIYYPDSGYNPWGHEYRINSWGPDGVNHFGGNRFDSMNRNLANACPNGNPQFVFNASNGLHSLGDIVWVGPKGGRGTHKDLYCPIKNGY
ncbi:prepilin-type N-terminal cleavage/methylation domain-containing protein [bacterium]|nr:prepilin-type N-terminal cleavage/methylation domain-containing protein [bacterium]